MKGIMRRRAGIGLLQAMIAPGMISVISAGLASVLGMSVKTSTGARATAEALSLETLLIRVFNSRALCETAFGKQKITELKPRIHLDIFKDGVLKARNDYGRFWKVESIEFPAATPGEKFVLGPVKIELHRRRAEGESRNFGSPVYAMEIPTLFNLDPDADSEIVGCSTQKVKPESNYETKIIKFIKEGRLVCCDDNQILITGYWRTRVGNKQAFYRREPGSESRCIRMYEGKSRKNWGHAELFCFLP